MNAPSFARTKRTQAFCLWASGLVLALAVVASLSFLLQLRSTVRERETAEAVAVCLSLGLLAAIPFTRALGRRTHAEARELSSLMELSVEIICSIDAGGRFTRINTACARIWGYSSGELLGRCHLDFVHPEDAAKTFGREIAGPAPDQLENRYLHKDGHIVDMLWSASWSVEQQVLFCIGHDITARKRAAEELQWKTALLEAQVNSSLDGLVVVNEKAKKCCKTNAWRNC